MKLFPVVAVFSLLASFSAEAATVRSATFNPIKKSIDVDVSYGGGCAKHEFKLEMDICYESMPVQCTAKIVDLQKNDSCEAMISETVSFKLSENGLDDRYFRGASIEITGDADWNGKTSSAGVVLPR